MTPAPSRDALLERAFSDIPSTIGEIKLRPLSAGSFTLLGRMGNPMMVGKESPAAGAGDSRNEMFAAVIQYVWVHSAPMEKVVAVETAEDIPSSDLKALGFSISIGEALGFLHRYQESALRMTASLTEVEPEGEESEPGKLPETRPVGSPVLFTPAEEPEIPFGKDTSSGSCPSSAPSPTSTPPTSPTEPVAAGAFPTLLPDLTPQTPPN